MNKNILWAQVKGEYLEFRCGNDSGIILLGESHIKVQRKLQDLYKAGTEQWRAFTGRDWEDAELRVMESKEMMRYGTLVLGEGARREEQGE